MTFKLGNRLFQRTLNGAAITIGSEDTRIKSTGTYLKYDYSIMFIVHFTTDKSVFP